ncbi:MAG: hypothetical protein LIP16_07490 [Clostridium sp.]|nr:hypothetical protein [Clostridium sp.]
MSKEPMKQTTKSIAGIVVMALLSVIVIAVSGPLYRTLRGPITNARPEYPLADGSYTYEAPQFDDKGYKERVSITVENGIIVSCSWDSFNEEGQGKKKLSMDGQYIMSESGPTWAAQAHSVASYVIEHQKVSGLANAEGYATDTIASVSINVYPFINGVEDCLKQAAKE